MYTGIWWFGFILFWFPYHLSNSLIFPLILVASIRSLFSGFEILAKATAHVSSAKFEDDGCGMVCASYIGSEPPFLIFLNMPSPLVH